MESQRLPKQIRPTTLQTRRKKRYGQIKAKMELNFGTRLRTQFLDVDYDNKQNKTILCS
jgi:hypothetical protein